MDAAERETLKAEVRRRRQAGESYGKIAVACGINKAQAHRWADDVTKRNGHTVTRQTLLTPKQRRFIRALPESRSMAEAALQAGVPVAGAGKWASQTLRREEVKSAFIAMLEKKGLGEDAIADHHSALFQATRLVSYEKGKDGAETRVEHPDGSTRVKAVELAWRLHGRLEQPSESGTNVQVQVLLNLGGPTQSTQVDDSIDVSLDSAEATGDSTTD